MLSFHNLLVRWTFGETKARKISCQAWEMLECSVKFAKVLFPKARFVICANNLSPSVQTTLSGIAAMNEVELLDTTDCLPKNLRKEKLRILGGSMLHLGSIQVSMRLFWTMT